MPHVIVKMHPGRSEQQKAQLTEAIVKDVMTFARVGAWVDTVYQPDILNCPGKLTRNRDTTRSNSAG